MSRYRIRVADPGPALWPDDDAIPSWAHPKSREYLKKRNITKEESYACDFHYAEKGFWAGRLLIPQYDKQDRLIFFQGRVLDDTEPRYKTSGPRTLYRCKDDSSDSRLIIVEGPFDCIAVFRVYSFVVATLGTQVSQRQIEEILSLRPKSMSILYDRDAIREAYILQLQLQPFVPTEVLICPGKDPADTSEELLREVLKT